MRAKERGAGVVCPICDVDRRDVKVCPACGWDFSLSEGDSIPDPPVGRYEGIDGYWALQLDDP